MGKPSSTQLSRKSSDHLVNTTISKETMTSKISSKRLRSKRFIKTNQSINKLFDQLRETSHNLSDDWSRNMYNTVIDVDDTLNSTIQRNNPESSIVIPDDEGHNACSTPKQKSSLHHSTPKRLSLDDLILAHSNNNTGLYNANVTREINEDSFLTIDLTTDTGFSQKESSVIDLATTTDCEVTIVEACNRSSMSGDSDVTVLRKSDSKLKKFTNGIANLNSAEKGKLLQMITETIFNGCSVPANVQSSLSNLQRNLHRAPETAEDTYIKEVILGTKASRCSTGSNVYHPSRDSAVRKGPRMIVIDGSNVAMGHGRHKQFSVRGLQICIDYFLRRGHVVKAFVPRFRCKYGRSSDPRLLDRLESSGVVIYTPSREIKGKTVTPYDDRYILQCAAEFDGVIVSGDNYRDLMNENPKWRFVIENRLLPFTWVDDMIMFPRDPLGRNGPTLEKFLRHDEPKNNVIVL